jgi:precorrin-2 dehydrogenase / sirohydrochlorin ferrochelatase
MYPIFLNLKGRRCLVVGGGAVAERKVEKLVESGARVIVVAPEATEVLSQMAADGMIDLEKRKYIEGEAGCYFLVISATDDPALNRHVSEDADMAGRPVNVVDAPELCNFHVPAAFSRGELQIAISTAGASPTLAKKIREDLECRFPPAYERLLSRLREFRESLADRVPDESKRKEILGRVVRAPETELYLEGNEAPFEALLEKCV